ncbi:alpha/beta fold hydrolase [Microbulbifer sediminum]|uniref:alpha/beta fold hydrolase n=1 Tax=Microbulbifer sediminum TaxID=2904250 RepID=UPI001F32B588|nr:alpha/beta fold hydrolase [Microbulbifer sediminum]
MPPTLETLDHQFGPFRVPVSLCRPAPDAPMLLVLPALGVPASRYQRLQDRLAAAGYGSAVTELPGTGASLPRPSRRADLGYSDLVHRFLPSLLERLAPPAAIVGHSIGGQVATLAAREGLTGEARIVTVAAGHLHYRCWRGNMRLKVLGLAGLAWCSGHLLGYFPGRALGFGGREARGVMADWATSVLSGHFPPEARPSVRSGRGPSLHLGISGDEFAPPAATARLASLLGGEVQHVELPRSAGNPHLNWLREPEAIVAALQRWLQ